MPLTFGDSKFGVQRHSRLQWYDSLNTGHNCMGDRNQVAQWQISTSDNELRRIYEDDWLIAIIYL